MYILYKMIIAEIQTGDKIILTDDDILFYGSNRVCYRYMDNPLKLIKIARNPAQWEKDHRQSFAEWYVYQHTNKAKKDCPISHCYRWIMTNLGPGLVVDKIIDNSGKSVTLRKLLYKKELTVNDAIRLVEEVIKKFSYCGIPASDFNIDNFILDGDHHHHKMVMVDGFSPKTLNLKTFFLLKSKWLASFYTRRKWQKAKSRFAYCAQKVYAGDYRYAAALPLYDTSRMQPSDVSSH